MVSCQVDVMNINHIRNGIVERESWFATLGNLAESADHICALTCCPADVIDALPAQKLVLVPTIYTDVYHPDATPLFVDGKAVPTLARLQHSKLAIFGFCSGFSPGQTLALYKGEVYRALGYMDALPQALLYAEREQEKTNWPFVAMTNQWLKGPVFMLNRLHPKLHAHADVCRMLVERLQLKLIFDRPEDILPDEMAKHHQWPVFPPIAKQFGLSGSYLFYVPESVREETGSSEHAVSLEDFVVDSFSRYAELDRSQLEGALLDLKGFDRLTDFSLSHTSDAVQAHATPVQSSENPYSNTQVYQRWRHGIMNLPPSAVDPVVSGKFLIEPHQKIATAGSCFAQHISKALKRQGFNYCQFETPAPGLTENEIQARGYGLYSARYGNIYNTRQLLQLFQRAFGEMESGAELWQRADGRFVDPLRPQVEPLGFPEADAVFADREAHLSAVRSMFETLDIFVFTLGLTEGWVRKSDGMAYPVAPGVVAGRFDAGVHEAVNFSLEQIVADLRQFWNSLLAINAGARLILSVSPVPLAATFEPRHVLTATTYSKAVLRVAADMMASENSNCAYFPSYEIITGNFNRGAYYDEDLRGVAADGVDHVMRLFLRHYTRSGVDLGATIREEARVLCDEELLL